MADRSTQTLGIVCPKPFFWLFAIAALLFFVSWFLLLDSTSPPHFIEHMVPNPKPSFNSKTREADSSLHKAHSSFSDSNGPESTKPRRVEEIGGRDHVILAHHPNSIFDVRLKLWPCMFILSDFGRYPPTVANVEKDVIAPYRHVIGNYVNDSAGTMIDRLCCISKAPFIGKMVESSDKSYSIFLETRRTCTSHSEVQFGTGSSKRRKACTRPNSA
uniref:Uncharacterized protein n=1 Tax=Ananas comosus var. bracteatus TaxID=296719 RepID=A0A6V7PR23_ANACO|nr:unnamed protein product [Ananas comosus var. bracteatus]